MLMVRGSTAEEDSTARTVPEVASCCFSCGDEACWRSGAAWCARFCRGAVIVAPFFAPSGAMLCFVLEWMSRSAWATWWAQTQLCVDAAVVVEGRRQKVSMLFSSLAPGPLFGWMVFSGLDFRGMAPMGRISARGGQKDSLKFKGDREFLRTSSPWGIHDSFSVPLYPPNSGPIHKHIVKTNRCLLSLVDTFAAKFRM